MKISKFFLTALATFIAVALPILPLSAQVNNEAAATPNEGGATVVITNADGTVTRRPATEGETVTSSDGQTISIEFSDGSSVTLAANSSASLSNISPTSTGDVQVAVSYGSISYNVPTPLTGKKIAITSPAGTAEVTEGSGQVELVDAGGFVVFSATNNTASGRGLQLTTPDGVVTQSVNQGQTLENSVVGSLAVRPTTISVAPTPPVLPLPPFDPTTTTDDGDPLTNVVSPSGEEPI